MFIEKIIKEITNPEGGGMLFLCASQICIVKENLVYFKSRKKLRVKMNVKTKDDAS